MDLSGAWSYGRSVSEHRLAHNKTQRHVSEYGDGIELLGVMGEICARRFLGLSEVLHEGFDHGVDILFEGMTIDVKATHLTPLIQHRYLQWPRWKPVKSDYILLAAIDALHRGGTILGYATRAEVLAAPINRDRRYPCREIAVGDLHPAWELEVEAVRHRSASSYIPSSGIGNIMKTYERRSKAQTGR